MEPWKILGVLAAVASAVVAVLAYLGSGPSQPGPSVNSPSVSSPSGRSGPGTVVPSDPSLATELASPTLTYPADGLQVSRSQGFVASGAAPSGLWPDTIWVLDHGTEYIVDTEAAIRAGKWSAPDRPLGDSSNSLPYDITMVAVLANPACTSRLSQLDRTIAGDHIPQLPPGCRQFGQVRVSVSKP
jgi:hypothetical protein